jgi:hypothetical protein
MGWMRAQFFAECTNYFFVFERRRSSLGAYHIAELITQKMNDR